MSPFDDQLQGLLDKQAITEVIHRYGRSMDRVDQEIGYSVFWPDAVADYHEQMFQGTGHGFIDWVLPTHLSFFASHSHRFSNILIDVAGDRARSETYVEVTLRRIDDEGRCFDSLNCGRYVDRWERRDGEWRIIHRRYLHDIGNTVPATAGFATTSRRDRLDPSYFPDDGPDAPAVMLPSRTIAD
jgi:hypothetical protein